MKLKVRPEDFVVRELLRLRLKPTGAFSVYRLEKRNWNTLDAIDHLTRHHGLRQLSRAGLKDRYALTIQYLSLPGKGPALIREPNYTLRLVGRSDVPVSSELLSGNEFTVTVRALSRGEAAAIAANTTQVRRFGLPNYFDDQRFGSARHGQGFIARRLIDGHYNGALKFYLATPSPAEPPKARRRSTALAERWGDWHACLPLVPPEALSAARHLTAHPGDFAGAVRRLPRSLLELFINAYQSWLWNETVVTLLRELGAAAVAARYSQGEIWFWRDLSPTLMQFFGKAILPVAAPDSSFRSERIQRAAAAVLAREGLDGSRLRLKLRIPGVRFKAFNRRILLRPEGLRLSEPQPDDVYHGRTKVKLQFTLPPGAYATLLIKRLALN